MTTVDAPRDPGCTGKVRFITRAAANRSRKIAQRIPGQRAKKLHVYSCGVCDGWHLTSWGTSRAEVDRMNGRRSGAA